MKPILYLEKQTTHTAFSALGRAVWDETGTVNFRFRAMPAFSALGRAVWDETAVEQCGYCGKDRFQCSRSSRMG